MAVRTVGKKPDIRYSQNRRRDFDDLNRKRTNGGSFLVPGAGIEPARPIQARDFKSLASTNSATQAQISGESQVWYSQASTFFIDKHSNCQDWTAWAFLVIAIR